VSLPVTSATIPELPGVTVYNGQGANVVPVPVTKRPRDGYAVTLNPPKDGTVNTDVISGPYPVAVHGAEFVGRTPYSELVMQVDRNPSRPYASDVQHRAHVADRARQVGHGARAAVAGGPARGAGAQAAGSPSARR